MQNKLENVAKKVCQDVYDSIKPCNLPDMHHQNRFYAPLVLIAQRECDKILSCKNKSVLERIMLSADAVEDYEAGNCLMQTFVAFKKLFKELNQLELSNALSCISLRIATTKTHAFLIIADKLVCDPWSNKVEWLSDSEYQNAKLGTYFAIQNDWSCYSDECLDDFSSTTFAKQYWSLSTTQNVGYEERNMDYSGL